MKRYRIERYVLRPALTAILIEPPVTVAKTFLAVSHRTGHKPGYT